MFFIFSKVLLFLLSPLIWIFILLLWTLKTKDQVKKKKLLWLTVIVFCIFSNPFISDEFVRFYEERNSTYSELNNDYDVAIVLGGFSGYDATQEMLQFNSAADRLLAGLKLYKTGKAKKLMIVSGSGSILNPEEKEALFVKDYLIKIGIPSSDLIIESESKNTRENAVKTAEILNEHYPTGKFILLTTASHMPRAKRCFNKVGLKTTPFSVDQKAGPRKFVFDHLFIPSIESLRAWNILTKEWAGLISYKLAGYI